MKKLGRYKGDKLFDTVNFVLLTMGLLLVLYPLYFIAIASISAPEAVQQGKTWLIPDSVTLDGYRRILRQETIWIGYRNSFFYMVLGTAINISLTLPAAYALSRKDLKGRGALMLFITFTMFFSGGLIPLYITVQRLGLINTIWAMVIPSAVSAWNLIVARTFYQSSIPNELLEASKIDGCSDTRFFISIVIPLSTALTAIMALFYGVSHWNSFFNALIYLRDENLYSLQLILRTILIQNQVQENMMMDESRIAEQVRISELIKYGVIIIASVPLLILYPFLQRFFLKGVMIGSIKG